MDFLPSLPFDIGYFGRLATLLLAAVVLAEFGQRWLRLPRITGYVVAGMLLGPSVLGWVPVSEARTLRPLAMLGLGLLLFELGSRVNLGWIRHNPWLLARSLAESTITFAAVFFFLGLFDFSVAVRTTVAAITVPTGAAIVMRVVAETRARGQMTEQLLLLTALNTIYGILLLKVGFFLFHFDKQDNWITAVLHPLYVASGSLLLAVGTAFAVILIQRLHLRRESERFVMILAVVLLATALSTILKLSTPLALLLGGIVLRTYSPRLQVFPEHMGTAGAVVVVMFFVLMGTSLDPSYLFAGGAIAIGLVVVRALAKFLGVIAVFGDRGLTPMKATTLGVAMLPMSSISTLHGYEVAGLFPQVATPVLTLILGMAVVMDLVGPIATQRALNVARETAAPEVWR